MAYIALYWSVLLVGYIIGSKCRNNKEKFNFLGNLLTLFVGALVFLMGIRMGSNEEVISNLGTIGLQALTITVILWIGTVLCITFIRRLMRIDKFGFIHTKSETESEIQREEAIEGNEEPKTSHAMTIIIIGAVAVGILIGYFYVRGNVSNMDSFNQTTSTVLTIGLCFLLFVIGLDMGLSGTVVDQLKKAGWRIFVFPIVVLIATALTAALCSLFMPITLRESLAVSFGFGWYTFAPIAITNAGHVVAGAISFMHNVFRELGGIVLIPILAKRIGYIEVTSLPGVAAMDICLPIVERSTRQEIVVYSFITGMVQSFMVPLLVPLIIGA